MERSVHAIVDKALGGGVLDVPELEHLFAVPKLSQEAYLIHYASRKLSEEASHGKAEVHGQLGLDVGPCPRDCRFCSFAMSNGAFGKPSRLSVDAVVEACHDFEVNGANAIYLMATGTYPLVDFLAMGRAAREAFATPVPLIANIDDFDDEGARQLKGAGFTGIYHALRLEEGMVTRIEPARRLATVGAARRAGLLVGTCLEPVGSEHTFAELAEKTIATRDMHPVFSGAMRRVNIPASPLSANPTVDYAQMALVLATVRLAMGRDVVGNCTHEPNRIGAMAGANLLWAEVGSNPRDMSESTVRGWTVQRARSELSEAGWDVLDGPSAMYAQG